MTTTSSSLLLALAITSGLGCSLLKINGKSLGGGSTTASEPMSSDDASSDSVISSPIPMSSAGGDGGKQLADLPRPHAKAAVTTWTPAQQYLRTGGWGTGVSDARSRDDLGFDGKFPVIAWKGNKLRAVLGVALK